MLLDRIDIDAHGPLHRVELFPLSEGLNVVLAPEGAGKTAVVRFVRDSLVAREYPLGMMNSSTGRVVWADRHGLIHCRREQDGSPRGRRTIEFESRGEYPLRYDLLNHSWIEGAADTTDASLALRSIQLPESIVDGVITDTSVTHVARIVLACLSLGLDSPQSGRPSASDGDRVANDSSEDSKHPQRHERLRAELAEVLAELAGLPTLTDDVLALTARRETLARRLERTAEGEPVAVGDATLGWIDREAVIAELRRLDDRLALLNRVEGLRRRQLKLSQLLGAIDVVAGPESPLAREASRWLIRLSAGRLRRIEWNACGAASSGGGRKLPTPVEARRILAVRIDGHDEPDCAAADRALTVLAVRMAAGDLLARAGRAVPLVMETHRELFGHPLRSTERASTERHATRKSRTEIAALDAASGDADRWHVSERMAFGTDPIASALVDYVATGRQLLVLTSSPAIMTALTRGGGRSFRLQADEVVHPHRPIWKSQYSRESYVGPHPHIYGEKSMDPMEPSHHQINRAFDAAWREAYGIDERPAAYRPEFDEHHAATGWVAPQSEWAARETERVAHRTERATPTNEGVVFGTNRVAAGSESALGMGPAVGMGAAVGPEPHVGTEWRDGVYYAHRYTTQRDRVRHRDHDRQQESVGPSSEVESHQDSAESSPFFLTVDSPIDQAPSIDAVVAARLRGLGITHIIHLMREDSNRLADTLGVANVNAAAIRRWQSECRLVCRVPQLRGFDARILVGCGISEPARLAAMPPMELLERVEAFLATERGQRILLSGTSYELCRITSWIASANRSFASSLGGRSSQSRSARVSRSRRGGATERAVLDRSDERRSMDQEDSHRFRNSEARVGLRLHTAGVRGVFEEADETSNRQQGRARQDRGTAAPGYSERPLEPLFHLDHDSPVEDVPAIGPRTAERLAEVGVEWVEDLLQADPETLAGKLHHRRVDAIVVRRWQDVATLMCRVPELQGHAARLLVAVGVTTPESLAGKDAEPLHAEIESIASSREGRRILQGRPAPGKEQVAVWIESAALAESLQAA